jgi:hypothetical protein
VYRQDHKFVSVEVSTENGLTVGPPRLLFEADLVSAGREDNPIGYDVSRDGNEIYAIRRLTAPPAEHRIALVTNWFSTLSRSREAK